MRTRRVVAAWVAALALTVSLAGAARAAAAAAEPRDAPPGSAAFSTAVPEVRPLPSTDYHGVLVEPGYRDLWSFSLGGGQQAIVELTPPEGEDFRLALWPPGVSDFSHISGAVATSQDPFDPQALKYVAPSSAGGSYVIDVWSNYTVVDDGSYRLTVDVQSPTSDVQVTAPDVPGTVSVGRDYTSHGTLRPRHFPGDESVTLEWQKYSGGRWRTQDTQRVENEDFNGITRYTVEYSFLGWGHGKMKWRVRAVHRADELHPRKASAWRTFWVRV